MKRVVTVAAMSLVSVVILAGNALASTTYPPPTTTVPPPPTSPPPTAFTGSNVNGIFWAIVALVVVGLSALFLARRRAGKVAS